MSAPGDALSARGRRRRVASENAFNKQQQESKRALYHCNYCQKDISNVVRIKCADCADFDLCLDCFAVGVEVAGHKRTHAYRVVDNLSFPLFHPDWGADEELLLLEAVDMYGLGNWGAVSEHVGTKPKEQCRSHYFQIYIDPDSCPLPTPAPEMAHVDIAKCVEEAKQGKGRKRARVDASAVNTAGTASSADAAAAPAAAAAAAAMIPSVKPEEQPQAAKAEPDAGADAAAEAAGSRDGEAGGAEASAAAEVKAEESGPSGGSGEKARKRQRVQPGKEEDSSSRPVEKQTSGRAVHATEGQQPAAGGTAEGDGQTALKMPKLGVPAAAGADGAPLQKLKSGTSITDITGYSRTRQEFETEWDNDAEQTIADLEFSLEDSEEDRAGKLRLLEIYNLRLDERERRRAFILEHDLLNLRHIQGLDRRRLPAERDQYARLRAFARYAPPKAHETFVDGLLTEERLRARIAELFEYRRNGIRTFADVEDYEQDRTRRPKAEAPDTQSAPEPPASLPPPRPPGSLPPRAAHTLHTSYAVLAGLEEPPQQPQQPARASGGASTSKGGKAAGGGGLMSGAAAKEAAERQRSLSTALTAWRHRRGVPLDISGLPGVETLTARERELCANARLLPSHYLSLKDMLMRDCDAQGLMSRSDVRGYFRLDPAKSQRIYDLLYSAGWLKGAPTPAATNTQRPLAMKGLQQGAAAAAATASGAEQGAVLENGTGTQEESAGQAGSAMQS